MDKIILLLSMMFLHIVDDYYLQGLLAKFKQKDWWRTNAPDSLYKHDYIIALFEHAFSWTFMIHVPVMFIMYHSSSNIPTWLFLTVFVMNWIIHAITDNEKANEHKINLIQDQLIHMIQVVVTCSIYSYMIL